MAFSGIEVSQATKDIFDKIMNLRKKGKMPGCVFKIVPHEKNIKQNSIEPVEGSFQENIETNGLEFFKGPYFKDDECCYLLYYSSIAAEGKKENPIPLLIHWSPDAAKIRYKMLSASSLDHMKSAVEKAQINGCHCTSFNTKNDVSLNGLSSLKCLGTSRPVILDGVRVKKIKGGEYEEDKSEDE
uniref:actin-depolymerizing factor 8-like n=1 Tax=Styela clava TaxID=7725 RepID=UPI001939A170|nr:actin-depolymerizing factor 8-like [Styela clava]